MDILIIINDPPYGTEKAYNALRLANTLLKEHDDVKLRIFLIADSVSAALSGQTTPRGFYNLERMLRGVIHRGGQIRICGSCAQARAVKDTGLIDGIEVSTMSQLAKWVAGSDKVITF